jgi:hypothetical protein
VGVAVMAEPNPNRRSSGVDRRASTRTSVRLSLENQDDYDLEAMGISDGFRPTTSTLPGHNRVPSHSSHRDRRSTPPPRPSSMTKPNALDTFALRHDGAIGQSARPRILSTSSSESSITRSSSVSTNMPVMRAESPYQGPAGPSHPYHMYPQNTRLARTASIATTSTIPVPSERLYSGLGGPTHPYAMYPQNTVPESEGAQDQIPLSSIPVGFPGHVGEYQRRLGPEGDLVADIIGPLGHTEQLPPYTKYPDEAFTRKITPVPPALIGSGAGGIGLATRNPEFSSREDLNSPLSRQSDHSMTSNGDQLAGSAPFNEKIPEKKWKTIARKRVWGIVPVWVFVLVVIMCIIFSLIVGIAVGIVTHQRKMMTTTPATPKGTPTAA